MIRLTLFLLTVLQISTFSSVWYHQNSGTNVSLNALYFVNINTGYVAGNNGIILKTTNKGLNWIALSSGTQKNLYSVYFTNNDDGYAVGDSIILKTTNSGISWEPYILNYPMKSVYFINNNTGYIASYYGTVIKTTNAGHSWYPFIPYSRYADYTCVFFKDVNTGYVVGLSGRYVKTVDGGNSWVQMPQFYPKNYFSIQFPSKTTGYLIGGWVTSMILKSDDAGENFRYLIDGMTGVRLFSASFIDTNNGIAVGRLGYIVRTTDGGINWDQETSGTNSILYGVQFLNSETAYIVGDNGTILTTFKIIGINQISTKIPGNFSLEQNYPNPFNPATKIKFSIPQHGFVTIVLYNVMGEEIKYIVSQRMNPGIYETELNASELPSGTYFYTLNAGDFHQTRKMVLVK